MRINQPITQNEYIFPDGESLVSTTDLSSHITYCNNAFIRTSGYTKEELLGQPHNLVRHPDMPPAAFEDMWQTLKSGLSWSALVKNRRKNGDHYWVVANATPIIENGKTVGYMSVRTKPSRAEVQAAEVLYGRMREEKSSGKISTVLRRGQVVRAGWLGELRLYISTHALNVRFVAALGVLSISTSALQSASLWTGLGSLAAAVALGVWLSRSVTQPLSAAAHIANRMAAGDLTQKIDVKSNDAIAQLTRALNQISVNIRAMVGDVRQEVAGINNASKEIASGNMDLSARTENQASNLEQTAASMEQLTSAVQHNSQTAQQAKQLATQASDVARRGNEAVSQVVSSMGGIHASSQKIADIIQVIDSIAFQTNILALNAAVEAARAGEQGRGFAVVASEVRSLAQRSSNAAKEIKELISASVQQVEAGHQHVGNAGSTMSDIQSSVQRVTDLIAEITSATLEQSSGINQVNEAMNQIDGMTQQNAALVEQSAAAAEALKRQSEALIQAVQIFKLS